jgi:hypothetical protein
MVSCVVKVCLFFDWVRFFVFRGVGDVFGLGVNGERGVCIFGLGRNCGLSLGVSFIRDDFVFR